MEKTALIVVPHQDDEINLVGNILDKVTEQFTTYVIYSSLDSNETKAKIRKKEALEACNLWGIGKEHIVFLEYPDTANVEGRHFFTEDDVRARKVIDDLKNNIYKIRPDVIFATDFDFHSDHRMISLAFDAAMGEILKEDISYIPTVYKGFCYETAFYGPEDYVASNPGMSTVADENILSNVSYLWDKRYSICGDYKPGFIWNKKAYKGLKRHKSQYAVLHARSIINADNVFWIKRTDNILRKASIKTTSGDASKLNDFMIIDTNDIITRNPLELSYEKALFLTQDNTCEISVEFNEPQDITEIIFHGDPAAKENIKVRIEICDENGCIAKRDHIESYGRATIMNVEIKNVSRLIIKLSEYSDGFGLSEIEMFNGKFESNFDKQLPIQITNKNNKLVDTLDLMGYKWIVFITKVGRKIKKMFA